MNMLRYTLRNPGLRAPITTTSSVRPLTTTRPHFKDPGAYNPPSRPNDQQSPAFDAQSSASTKGKASTEGSDADHPAKQPDPQAQPTRDTGFGGRTNVEGGSGKSGQTRKGS
ncbi:uncharacterized protein K452DRAFT_354900 [Aplosporella prunicola CBS 121167]|uniref:Uncharacterized protein n=1 Tax=Aplosporella prunicola CBS 121167 TaxID=1176127 RepID=A0A6A6BUP1_9PEZI|nr:uncharacterized protein K452DRAFT_354900 [Aplosporella prunicola CBS 121167]KAF2147538.1 hypothetical protein K452DRAFT_354900 [Aplosporella prunicola CBS 121167]